jgi:hypothetical protein
VPHTNTKKKICLINFERNTLRKIYGPILENEGRRLGWKNELCDIYNDLNIIQDFNLKDSDGLVNDIEWETKE